MYNYYNLIIINYKLYYKVYYKRNTFIYVIHYVYIKPDTPAFVTFCIKALIVIDLMKYLKTNLNY